MNAPTRRANDFPYRLPERLEAEVNAHEVRRGPRYYLPVDEDTRRRMRELTWEQHDYRTGAGLLIGAFLLFGSCVLGAIVWWLG